MEEVTFRKAVREDVPLILEFIKGLAEYEKMSDEVVATEEILDEWLFDKEKAEVIFAIAEGEEVRIRPVSSTIFPPSWPCRAFIWKTCS